MRDQPSLGQLRWRCRRGMKELDYILGRWLETRYATSTEPERQAFRDLLDTQDPQLLGWLLGGECPDDPGLASLVRQMTGREPPVA